MDQVKKFLAIVKKQHFWILTGLIVIVAAVGYVMARMSLSKLIADRKAKVEGAYTDVRTVASSVSLAPNRFSHEQMKKIKQQVASNVADAWGLQYNRQRPLFQWPLSGVSSDDKDVTLTKLAKLLPIEALDVKAPEPLTQQERSVYRDGIHKEFPRLASIIGSEWTAEIKAAASNASSMPGIGGSSGYGGMGQGSGSSDMSSAGNMNSGRAATARKKELVEWPTASQQELANSIVGWYNPNQPPRTLDICYTQEDLWILEGLLRIIAATNGAARENFQATIKEIEYIRFGRLAQGMAGELKGTGASGASGMPGMPGGGMPGMPGMGGPGGGGSMPPGYGGGGGGGTGTTSTTAKAGNQSDPAEGRYVDRSLELFTAAKLRSAIKTGLVAKQVPVRIRFSKMDERNIFNFLAQCANAQLALEVKQIRINASPVSLTAQGGGMPGADGSGGGAARPTIGSAGGGSAGASVGLDMDTGSGGYGGANGGAAASQAKLDSGYDVPVEVFGVISLYNPVDWKALGEKERPTVDQNQAPGDGKQPAIPADKTPPADKNSPVITPPATNPADNTPAPPAADQNPSEEAGAPPPDPDDR